MEHDETPALCVFLTEIHVPGGPGDSPRLCVWCAEQPARPEFGVREEDAALPEHPGRTGSPVHRPLRRKAHRVHPRPRGRIKGNATSEYSHTHSRSVRRDVELVEWQWGNKNDVKFVVNRELTLALWPQWEVEHHGSSHMNSRRSGAQGRDVWWREMSGCPGLRWCRGGDRSSNDHWAESRLITASTHYTRIFHLISD